MTGADSDYPKTPTQKIDALYNILEEQFPGPDAGAARLKSVEAILKLALEEREPRTAKASPDGIKLATAEQVAKQYVKNIRDGVYADDEAAATALEGLLLASYPRVGS